MILFSDILSFHAGTSPERIALIIEGNRYSYQSLYNTTLLKRSALDERRLTKGDRVAISGTIDIYTICLINACLCTGIVPVIINPQQSGEVLQHIINDASCKYFFVVAKEREAILRKIEDTIEVVQISNETNGSYHKNAGNKPNLEDEAIVIYTSGSSGLPKGVSLSHKNLLWMQYCLRSITPAFGPEAVNFVVAPWFVIVGIGYYLFGVYAGCTNVIQNGFNPLQLLDTIQKERVTNAFIPPVVITHLLELEEFYSSDLSSLRHIQYGGANLPESSLLKLSESLDVHLTKGYGLTESSGIGTAFRFDDHLIALQNSNRSERILQSVGKPYESISIEIRDERGQLCDPYEEGVICLSGPTIAMGYIGLESDRTKQWNNGWFVTGDVGYIDDDGFLFLTDRKDGLILSKGYNVYPATVERELLKCPGVKGCIILGIPHRDYGEVIGAFLVAENHINEKYIREWASKHLPSAFLPYEVHLARELPLGPSGKVDKQKIKEILVKKSQ